MKKIFTVLTVLVAFVITSCSGSGASGSVIAGVGSMNGDFSGGWGNNSYDVAVAELVHGWGGLLTFDEGGKVYPGIMTESREQSADLLTHTFKLKEGIKFHDGSKFTADDVIFTYNLYMDEDALTEAGGSANLNQYIDSITKVDDYTVKFVLSERIYTTDSSVFMTNILSEEFLTKDKPEGTTVQQYLRDTISNPVGLGPYKFVEYIENQWVKLEIFEDYPGNFRGVKPSIQNIVVKITDNATDYDELETGSIDILPGVVEGEKINSAKAADHLTFNNYPRHGYGYMAFHTDYGVTADVNVRKAIGYMMDRAQFINVFLGEYGSATQGPYSTNYWMIDDAWIEANLEVYVPNKEKSAELLEASGYVRNEETGYFEKDGEELVIKFASPMQRWTDSLNLVFSDKVQKEYGIQFDIQTLDFSVLLSHFYGSGAEGVAPEDRMYNAFALATSLQPMFDGYANWHSDQIYPFAEGQSNNTSRFDNEENDRLLMVMRETADDEEFGQAYRDWVKLMNQELPLLPLYSNDYHDLYNAKIKNFKTSALYRWQYAILEANL